jgi:hypothetical protein
MDKMDKMDKMNKMVTNSAMLALGVGTAWYGLCWALLRLAQPACRISRGPWSHLDGASDSRFGYLTGGSPYEIDRAASK